MECHNPERFATSCLQSVVFPVPEGAEIIKRIPRRSAEESGWAAAGAVELVVLLELIRRFGPVRGYVRVRLS